MTRSYQFLVGIIWYIPNLAVRDGSKSPDIHASTTRDERSMFHAQAILSKVLLSKNSINGSLWKFDTEYQGRVLLKLNIGKL